MEKPINMVIDIQVHYLPLITQKTWAFNAPSSIYDIQCKKAGQRVHISLFQSNSIYRGCYKMPAIVGVVQVIAVGSGAVFHIGDVYKISTLSNAKTFAGAGSFNTGDSLYVQNHQSSTNTIDTDGTDQGNFFNV